MSKPVVSFLGLGNMGAPMAANLLKAGFAVRVYNRSQSRAAELVAAGAEFFATPAAAVVPGGIVVTMLANDAALDTVTDGEDGLLTTLGSGGLHISMSTVSPETTRRLAARHAENGSALVAAPVFGRPEAAAAQKLWICLSGDATAKARAKSVLDALGQATFDFGDEAGAANVVKLSGNFMILAAIEALSESLAFAEKNGLERQAVIDFFAQTMFACPIYQNYGRILAGRSYAPAGFKLELGMKDIRLVRDAAETATVTMPLADLLHARLLTSLAKDRSQLDWTAIELVTADEAGLLAKS